MCRQRHTEIATSASHRTGEEKRCAMRVKHSGGYEVVAMNKSERAAIADDLVKGAADTSVMTATVTKLEDRLSAEAQRLTNLAPGEWRLWYRQSAEQLGMAAEDLGNAIEDILKERTRQAEVEERRKRESERALAQVKRRHHEKAKSKRQLFKQVKALPEDKRQAEIRLWCATFDEHPEVIFEEVGEYLGKAPTVEHTIDELEPWPNPVDGGLLLEQIQARIRRHIVISECGAIATSFWILQAWLHADVAIHSPILAPFSAEPDSGKSTLLHVTSFMCPRSIIEVRPTVSIYQTINESKPTWFVEEADNLFEDRALQEIVNASWIRGSAKVYRIVRGVRTPFDVFCPKAIGLLGRSKVPPSTASRCIFIEMLPKLPTETVDRFEHADDQEFQDIRRKAMRWAADNAAALKSAEPWSPSEFANRVASNWRLMFAISDAISSEWSGKLRAAAVRLTPISDENMSWPKRLLTEFRAAFERVEGRDIASEEMAKWLTEDELGAWSDYKGHAITQREIAHLLRTYGIHHTKIGPTTSRRWGYRARDFEELFARILQDPLPRSGHLDTRKTKVSTCPDLDGHISASEVDGEASDLLVPKALF
jgi:phosphoglycolate phosphatase-like HAD superfamily hydrolase